MIRGVLWVLRVVEQVVVFRADPSARFELGFGVVDPAVPVGAVLIGFGVAVDEDYRDDACFPGLDEGECFETFIERSESAWERNMSLRVKK